MPITGRGFSKPGPYHSAHPSIWYCYFSIYVQNALSYFMAEKKLETTEAIDLNEEKILFEWEAPERVYQQRTKDFWVTAISILVLLSVILIFIKEYFLIMALMAVLFLYYALSTVEPGKIKNKITNWGIYFGELRYSWNVFEKFWFKKSMSTSTINFGTSLKFPRVVTMVINPTDEDKIKDICVKRIPLLESPPTFVDKLTKWFGDRLPLEDRKADK